MAQLTSPLRSAALAAALVLSMPAVLAQGPAGTAAATTRVSSEVGVTIKVTPVARMGGEWLFAVVLETQAGSLGGSIEAQSVLVAGGEQLKASQWDGTAPGATRREGILTFPAPKGEAKAVEIRIRRDGEAAPRVFRWEAADL